MYYGFCLPRMDLEYIPSSFLCFQASTRKKTFAWASGANNVCKVGPLFPEQRT